MICFYFCCCLWYILIHMICFLWNELHSWPTNAKEKAAFSVAMELYLCGECVRCLEVSLWFLWDFLHHVPEISCLPNKMNIGESLKKFCFTKFSKIVNYTTSSYTENKCLLLPYMKFVYVMLSNVFYGQCQLD